MKIHKSTNSIMESRPALSPRVSRTAASAGTLQIAIGLLSRGWNWVRVRQLARSTTNRLQVTSTVSLGEKRFVALIQVDGTQFLVGGGAGNVALLAQLNTKEPFGNVLSETLTLPGKKPVKPAKKQTDKLKVARKGQRP